MSDNDYLTHEALHMSSFLMNAVSIELCEHSAIRAVAEWHELADKAHDALFDLYQAIGVKHLGDRP